MSWPDWGNVPSWAAAGSLFLAYMAFVQDRRRRRREHVDNVSMWASFYFDPEHDEDNNLFAGLRVYVKNATNKSILLRELVATAKLDWLEVYPGKQGVYTKVGSETLLPPLILNGYQIPPGRTLMIPTVEWEISRYRPSDDLQPDDGSVPSVVRATIEDGYGRRWLLEPDKNPRAKLHRWYHYWLIAWREGNCTSYGKTTRFARFISRASKRLGRSREETRGFRAINARQILDSQSPFINRDVKIRKGGILVSDDEIL